MHNETPTSILEIKNRFQAAKSWEAAYKLLVSMSHYLPNLESSLKIESNMLEGCESNVWLVAQIDINHQTIHLQADSDSKILRGILFIVTVYLRSTPLSEFNEDSFSQLFSQLGIFNSLSASRKTGIGAINLKLLKSIQAASLK